MTEDRPRVVVYPPDAQGGRRVRADGEILGRALDPRDLLEFLRRAGLDPDNVRLDDPLARRRTSRLEPGHRGGVSAPPSHAAHLGASGGRLRLRPRGATGRRAVNASRADATRSWPSCC